MVQVTEVSHRGCRASFSGNMQKLSGHNPEVKCHGKNNAFIVPFIVFYQVMQQKLPCTPTKEHSENMAGWVTQIMISWDIRP